MRTLIFVFLLFIHPLCGAVETPEKSLEEVKLRDGRVLEGQISLGNRHQHLILHLFHPDGRAAGSINIHEYDIVARRVTKEIKDPEPETEVKPEPAVEAEQVEEAEQLFNLEKAVLPLRQNQARIDALLTELREARQESAKLAGEIRHALDEHLEPSYQSWFDSNKSNLLAIRVGRSSRYSGYRPRYNTSGYATAFAEWQREPNSPLRQKRLMTEIKNLCDAYTRSGRDITVDIGNVDWGSLIAIRRRHLRDNSTINSYVSER